MPVLLRIVRIICLALLLPVVGGPAHAQSPDAAAARERAAAGDYEGAILLYRSAIEAADAQSRETLRAELDQVTRDYYAELYELAQTASSRDERIQVLKKAHSLELRGWLLTEFERTVFGVRRLTDQTLAELWKQAEAAVQAREYARAVGLYEEARALDPSAFDQGGFAADYEDLKERIRRGEELADRGEQLLRQSRYSEARQAFEEADRYYPGQQRVQDGLRHVESAILIAEARRHLVDNRFWAAEDFYARIVQEDPEHTEARQELEKIRSYRSHVHQGRLLYRQGECEPSRREFEQAERISASWFRRDQLDSVLNGDCSQPMPLPTREVREALLILFEGRPRVAIEILETLSQELGDSHVQVPAFLGAAYCHIAFLNPGADSSVLEKAREQFRVVLKVQPHYQLPETLFSPRVRAMLDSLR